MSTGSDGGIFCLVHVRNGAAFLDPFFACLDRLNANVIALDDESTDDTRELIRARPRVRRLLTNPKHPEITGWDDAENRRRQLAACVDFPVRWVSWIDIDELLPMGNDQRLLTFLVTPPNRIPLMGWKCCERSVMAVSSTSAAFEYIACSLIAMALLCRPKSCISNRYRTKFG